MHATQGPLLHHLTLSFRMNTDAIICLVVISIANCIFSVSEVPLQYILWEEDFRRSFVWILQICLTKLLDLAIIDRRVNL